MDRYRENYKKAKQLADKVLLLKKGRYLDSVSQNDIYVEAESFMPNITNWHQFHGFRMCSDETHTETALQNAVNAWIRSTADAGYSAVFALSRNSRTLSVLYGTGRRGTEEVLKANIPECSVGTTRWYSEEYKYNGIFTGTLKAKKLSDTFASSGIINSYISCIISPLSDAEIQGKIEENRKLLSYFSEYKTFQRTYGNASRRIIETPIADIVEAITVLKEENAYIEENVGGGFVRSAVKFGANTRKEYQKLTALIQSCLEYDCGTQTGFEPPRCFNVPSLSRSWRDCITIPFVNVASDCFSGKVYTLSLQDIKSVTSFCVPPMNSYEGYFVKNYNITEDSFEAFPITRPGGEPGVKLGKICNSSYLARIPFSSMRSHTFVSGATDTGKTTSVKKILIELFSAGIPFTVIEAAKKEYISLLGCVPNLKIYTPGTDGLQLSFNPLQPEDGVLIENHVSAVVRSLIAATGGEHPIPEAYDGLLKQTYRRYGWEYGMMAYHDENRLFPTFQDVFEDIDSYIAGHADYGPEVKQNLTAALKLRTENMHAGALGGIFRNKRGLMAADLLAAPCVIELADFSSQSAAFIMNLLLFKFQSYLSKQPESRHLNRVIVIEEAHNIFKQTIEEDSGRAVNNEYFDKMLAEIRSSGTGLILSDQRPSIMSTAVMANTSVKIMHALVDKADREAIGFSGNLTDYQIKKLSEFQTGECVIAIRGKHGVLHANVAAAESATDMNAACHVCLSRFRCRRAAVESMMETMDTSKITFYLAKIKANPYNIPALEKNISNLFMDLGVSATDATKICLLGAILKKYEKSMQESRIITNSYAQYLKRRAVY